jgi:maleate isomerase
MWREDGWEAQWRIGVITPHADVGPESELRAMAPSEIGIHAARVPLGVYRAPGGTMDPTIALKPVRAFAEAPELDTAVELLAAAPVHAIAYAFTSSAYVLGTAGEAAMLDRLRGRSGGIPIVATCAAAVEALRAMNVGRIALFDPPWFDVELNTLGRRYYESAEFEVVSSSPCDLPSGQALIQPADLYESIRAQVPDSAEALVLGGNGFRAVGVIDALETNTGKPVISPNQVLLWAALRSAGAPPSLVEGYGRVFSIGASKSNGSVRAMRPRDSA